MALFYSLSSCQYQDGCPARESALYSVEVGMLLCVVKMSFILVASNQPLVREDARPNNPTSISLLFSILHQYRRGRGWCKSQNKLQRI